MTMLSTTGQRLGHFIESQGITKTQFANDLKTSQPAISAMVSGTRPISRGMLARIASKYPQLNLTWLQNGTGNMLNPENCSGDRDFIGRDGNIFKKNTIITERVSETEIDEHDNGSEKEILRLKAMLFDRDEEIARLKAEIKKLKSK